MYCVFMHARTNENIDGEYVNKRRTFGTFRYYYLVKELLSEEGFVFYFRLNKKRFGRVLFAPILK